jgi:putative hydrolase of the HAD superfamily
MPRPVDEFVAAAARRLGVDLEPRDCARVANACVDAGFPGGPYPRRVPEHLREIYERRDLSAAAHRAAYSGLLSTAGLPHPDMAAAIYDEILAPEWWIPYADASALLDELGRRGTKTGLISNVGFDLRPIVRANGFDALAENCKLSYEVGAAKPDRRIFEAALGMLESDPGETLMVGDHEEVDRGGEVLGMRTVILPMTPPGMTHGLMKVLELL